MIWVWGLRGTGCSLAGHPTALLAQTNALSIPAASQNNKQPLSGFRRNSLFLLAHGGSQQLPKFNPTVHSSDFSTCPWDLFSLAHSLRVRNSKEHSSMQDTQCRTEKKKPFRSSCIIILFQFCFISKIITGHHKQQ